MEAAVRWSPFSTGHKERYLIVDVSTQSLSLHQITSRTRSNVQHQRVARCDRLPNFGAFDWSKTDESVVAVGLVSGSATVVKLREDGAESNVIGVYKLKQERKCNSLALSSQDWLAVGLDKTRADLCLNIYDITRDYQTHAEPIRRFCSAEVVSSVRFSPKQPQQLIAAVQRSFIRLYDLRDSYFNHGAGGNVQIATRNVNNIAIDPLDDNYFASAGSTDDPSVSIWDKRWIVQSSGGGSNTGAVLEFRPAVDNTTRASVWSLRFSGQRRGRLAICASTGELKVIDTAEAHSSQLQTSDYLPVNPYGGTSWSCNRYVSRVRTVQMPLTQQEIQNGASPDSRLMAFDWMSSTSSSEQPIIMLRRSRQVEVTHVANGVPMAEVNSRHDFSRIFEDVTLTSIATPNAGRASTLSQEQQSEGKDLVTNPVIDHAARFSMDSPKLQQAFADASLQQRRCRAGYLFDSERNRAIVNDDWQLERLWEVIEWYQDHAAGGGMIYGPFDLSYLGVKGIWREEFGKSPKRKISSAKMTAPDAICNLVTSKEMPTFVGERTNFPEHRQLCLSVCGWKFTPDALEEECQELIDRELYYQAIVQAVLHDYKHIALNFLRTLIRSKTIPNIGLGALLASDTINDEQREMCQWMAADTDDPALKALLTFLTSGDWRDVMKTNYLNLAYRVALGLKYLNDTELSGFIQSETARAVKNGDLEGILLTGLGEQGMDLFQTYITRTNDLQTAVLAMAFTNPLYVDDVRWEMWRDTYFTQMQSWRCFVERTRFVVQHNQIARTRTGESALPTPKSQIYLRCLKCQAAFRAQPEATSKAVVKSPDAPIIGAGIVCHKCGSHMPRCGICKLWLGMPDRPRGSGKSRLDKLSEVLSKFLTFCINCEHGFHADHARSWFQQHDVCPVPNCECPCNIR